MNKLLITIALSAGVMVSANAADIYVNNSGQGGAFSTIGAAISAAAPNDRIFVSPYGAYTENLVITQNITLTSAVSGTKFTIVGTVTINGAANMDVRIIGAEVSSNITANTGGATLVSRANIYLSDCSFNALSGGDYNVMHVLFCETKGDINLRHGEVRGCKINIDNSGTSKINVSEGPNAGIGDTLSIVANEFIGYSYISWTNNDNYFYIANNFISNSGNKFCIKIYNHQFSAIINNMIVNNTLRNSGTTLDHSTINSTSTANIDNIQIWNNIIENIYGTNYIYSNPIRFSTVGGGTAKLYYNYLKGYATAFLYGAVDVVGNDSRGYNVASLTLNADGSCDSTADAVDKGSPNLQYYDIDLTRGDRGTFGGPDSIDNYTSTATGNARVYSLDMPFEIWSGQTPQVKAESTHTK